MGSSLGSLPVEQKTVQDRTPQLPVALLEVLFETETFNNCMEA
jgi:hypothetical protein